MIRQKWTIVLRIMDFLGAKTHIAKWSSWCAFHDKITVYGPNGEIKRIITTRRNYCSTTFEPKYFELIHESNLTVIKGTETASIFRR